MGKGNHIFETKTFPQYLKLFFIMSTHREQEAVTL